MGDALDRLGIAWRAVVLPAVPCGLLASAIYSAHVAYAVATALLLLSIALWQRDAEGWLQYSVGAFILVIGSRLVY